VASGAEPKRIQRSRSVKARYHGVGSSALSRSIRLACCKKNLVEDVPELEENRRQTPD